MYFIIALLISIILLCLLTPYEGFENKNEAEAEIEVEMPAGTPEELGGTIAEMTKSFNQMNEDSKYDSVDESQLEK